MKYIKQQFSVSFQYPVYFTRELFSPGNRLFADLVRSNSRSNTRKVLFVLDEGVVEHHPALFKKIEDYYSLHNDAFSLIPSPVNLPGGEASKNDPVYVKRITDAVDRYGIDRHSFIAVIGGGAVIDTAGYAAATSHRGIRLIRIPTTVLSQNDASIGVKNGINAYGKKNFLGTFEPPYAVLNDSAFLETLSDRDWVSGISEAIKVALIKDASFFAFLEAHALKLKNRDAAAMDELVYRCAELHLDHISSSGDPFETGSSRPLDFGHWSAHKLEQLTGYDLKHGEAVAVGIALDSTYSFLKGMLTEAEWHRILDVLKSCGFSLYVPELEYKLDKPDHNDSILHGLEEFREHLGGELTIMLIEEIGKGVEVHEADYEIYRQAIQKVQSFDAVISE